MRARLKEFIIRIASFLASGISLTIVLLLAGVPPHEIANVGQNIIKGAVALALVIFAVFFILRAVFGPDEDEPKPGDADEHAG
jgi:hypothetical protein